jgi:lipopolysaccharide/colanic/teichoic acid biosynthesis glycosyltransferase
MLPFSTDGHPDAPGVAEASAATILGDIPPDRCDTIFRRLLALADIAAAGAGLSVVGAFTGRQVPAVTLIAVPLIVVMAKVAGRYDHDELVMRKSTLDEAPSLFALSAAFALVFSAMLFLAGAYPHWGGEGVVVFWASTSALLLIARSGARVLAATVAPPERALIVGDADSRAKVTQALSYEPSAHVEIVGYLPLETELGARLGGNGHGSLANGNGHRPAANGNGYRAAGDGNGHRGTADCNGSGHDGKQHRMGESPPADLESAVRSLAVDRVFLVPPSEHGEEALGLVRRATATGAKVSIVPRLFEVVGSAVEFDAVGGLTVLGVRRPGLSRSSQLLKRCMDVIGSAVGLLVLAPFGLLAAAAIKLDSPGPVLFRQARVGRGGRRFQMIKFRSMVEGAERERDQLEPLNESSGLFKLSDDPRVTRVGRWLRGRSLDELPQLINVLRGEMSLVGPRPLVIHEDALIEGWHRERLQLMPGMTGPWQVLGPQRPPLAEMVKVDYLYAANWSPWNDVKILLRTLGHVVARRGV